MHGTSAIASGESAVDRHVAALFAGDAEWADHLVAFVRPGVDQGEQVRYFADVTDPGLEHRRVTAPALAALAAAPAEHVTLDLSALDHVDVEDLAGIARAVLRRSAATPLRRLSAPPALRRLLELFPELGGVMEVPGR